MAQKYASDSRILKSAFFSIVTCLITSVVALGQGRPSGGQGGAVIPHATSEQLAALGQMNADLAGLQEALTAARLAVVQSALAASHDDAAMHTAVDSVRNAEQELANARADSCVKIQASSNKLTPEQIAAISATGGAGHGGQGARGNGTVPHLTGPQGTALLQMTNDMKQLTAALTDARRAVIASSLTEPRDNATIKMRVDAVAAAELALAAARAHALAKIQASANKLDPEQLTAFIAASGVFGQGGFTHPDPLDFNDHRGYVSLFDGVSLKGWDGNPKFWRVEDHAIVGESTLSNPSGNSYLVYRGTDAHDFTLKFEIKVEGTGGSGMQYRSKDGIPWRGSISPEVTANVGPVNLRWMQTGPQADFWPSEIYSGQFYSENSPMGIMAYRGQVVEGAGLGSRRLMGTIGDLTDLGKLVKANDWNEYTVIARGGVFLHIINGQLMAVMIDDDPDSSNNWTGKFGIEIEAITKVSVRNVWLKKLN